MRSQGIFTNPTLAHVKILVRHTVASGWAEIRTFQELLTGMLRQPYLHARFETQREGGRSPADARWCLQKADITRNE